MSKSKKVLQWVVALLLMTVALLGVAAMTLNYHVIQAEKENIVAALDARDDVFSAEEIKTLKQFDADCILVLGAGISDPETPSPMLRDRLDAGILLYEQGVAPKILLTGDNGTEAHNEIHVMYQYVKNAGVPEEDIFCDHAGFSTYESMVRAGSIFEVSKMIVVTQTYHEYRALYLAEKLGYEARGAAADQEVYSGQPVRELREIAARIKDFFTARLKPAAMGGEKIPISGSGEESHGE